MVQISAAGAGWDYGVCGRKGGKEGVEGETRMMKGSKE